jgi:membrane protein implicated in regulation of membrane protease activity
MPRRRTGMAIGLLGVCFLAFYLLVRLLFMEQLDAKVAEADVHSLGDLMANLSGPILVWMIWGYSFRVGMLLAVIGGALHTGMGKRELWLLIVGGAAYLASCYVPFIDYSPRYYGILGTAILVLFLFLVWDWVRRRPELSDDSESVSDLRMVGHYFLVTATWSLCGIFGIVTYALQPQIMMARWLRPAAVMLTSHVMAEFTLGWFFLALASRKEPMAPPQ